MRIVKNIWRVFGLIGLLVASAAAQGDPNSNRLVTPVGHVSKGGRFAISLPVDVTAQRQITPSQGTRGGMQYFWRTGDGEFFVSFYDNTEKPEDAQQELEQLRYNYLSGVLKNGGKSISKSDLTLGKYFGKELRASLQTKETIIIRYYAVEKRIFIISTRVNVNETGEKQLKVLNSFKLVLDSKS
jgi:hypothetical protein